jgi:hypothetical protein
VGQNHLGSGLVDFFYIPTEQAITTTTNLKAVAISSGSFLTNAEPGSGLRMPAVGIVIADYVSGAAAQVITFGAVRIGGGADLWWSGQAGKPLYVGSGGNVQAQAKMVSGQSWQRIGVAFSGGLIVNPDVIITSGGLTGPAGTF